MEATKRKSGMRRLGLIETSSGRVVNVFRMRRKDICITDIAHALSNLCRYGGHCPQFYSVAQHSVICSYHREVVAINEHALATLIHDATEAYLVDVPRPIKYAIRGYVEIERRLEKAIYSWAGIKLTAGLRAKIKRVDNFALRTEAYHMVPSRGANWNWSGNDYSKEKIYPLGPEAAKQLFLDRWEELLLVRSNDA